MTTVIKNNFEFVVLPGNWPYLNWLNVATSIVNLRFEIGELVIQKGLVVAVTALAAQLQGVKWHTGSRCGSPVPSGVLRYACRRVEPDFKNCLIRCVSNPCNFQIFVCAPIF